MDKDTIVEWGSVTKQTVWLSIMQLWESGDIDLNADIRTYLPDGGMKNLSFDEPVTVMNLMCHNAGFEETVVGMSTHVESDIISLEDYLRRHQPKQVFRPGEVVAYSNWGAALAGYIVERISGTPFYKYAHEHIFDPLGMKNTAIAADSRDADGVREKRDELKGYLPTGQLLPNSRIYINMYPAGMCMSTLTDFETFAHALLTRDKRLLSAKGFEEMYSPTLFYTGTDIPRNHHGFWGIEYASHVIGHGGNTNACSSYLYLDLENQVGAVILTNQYSEPVFNNEIAPLVFGTYSGDTPLNNVTEKTYCLSARTVFNGPLKLMKLLSTSLLDPDKFNSQLNETQRNTMVLNQTGDRIEYMVMDIVEVSPAEFFIPLVLTGLWALAVVASIIHLIVKLIKLISKKLSVNPMRHWHTFMNFLLIFTVLVALAFVVLMQYNVIIAQALSAAMLLLGVIITITTIYGICTFSGKIKTVIKAKGLIATRNILAIMSGIVAVANIVYWQMFMFWAL